MVTFFWLCLCLSQVAAVPVHPMGENSESEMAAGIAQMAARRGWHRGERVPGGELVHFRVAVHQSGIQELEDVVLAVSDAASARYGQHLSLDEVQQLLAPPPESLKTVRSWLREGGVRQMQESSNGDFIEALLPAAKIESLLQTTLYRYYCRKANANATIVRPTLPTLPAHVRKAIDFVTPGSRFPEMRRRMLKQPPPTPPTKEGVTPSMLRKLYNISEVGGKSNASSQAVVSFLHEYFSPVDLLSFQLQYSPESQGRTPKVIGDNLPASPTLEASLDIQYIMSVGPSVPTEFWYTPGKQVLFIQLNKS